MTDIPAQEHRVGELKNLRNKANTLASIHSALSDKFGVWHTYLSSALLLVSSVLVGLTFISEQFVQSTVGISPNALKWIVGIISILNFSGVLLLSQWGFDAKAATHRDAVRFYFKIVNRIRFLLENNIELTDEVVEAVRTEYSRTETLPKIPEGAFLELKQRHLQKIAVSRELDRSPFESLKSIRVRLSKASGEQK